MTSDFQKEATQPADDAVRAVVVLTGRRAAFLGRGFQFSRLRNATPAIAVGLNAPIALTEAGERNAIGDVLILPAGARGRLAPQGALALLFTDPLRDSVMPLAPRECSIDALRAQLRRGPVPDGAAFLEQAFQAIGVRQRPEARGDVARVVQAIGEAPDRFDRLETAAAMAGLSPARFRHVFVEAVGMTFSRYRQWRRMGIVIRQLAQGDRLTQAALAAGFAGSAHLSAAFRDMFGVSPSALVATNPHYVIQ